MEVRVLQNFNFESCKAKLLFRTVAAAKLETWQYNRANLSDKTTLSNAKKKFNFGDKKSYFEYITAAYKTKHDNPAISNKIRFQLSKTISGSENSVFPN